MSTGQSGTSSYAQAGPSTPRPTPSSRPQPARRTSRSGSFLQTSGVPAGGTGAHDLPSSAALADLELVRSGTRGSRTGSVRAAEGEITTVEFRGGGGLGRESSRASVGGANNPGRRGGGGKGEKIEEHHDEENGDGDEEAKIGGGKDEQPVFSTEDEETLKMYARFSEGKKHFIVAIVAYAALLAPFSSASFLPSIPNIVEDLDTNATILNITVAVFILVVGITPLIWAPFSGIYGRRPIYILSLPMCTLGSMGVALSRNLTSLIITRIIQGMGSSAVLSVGAGTIGDLYPRERRGKAMGLFYSGVLIGPALAPTIAGILTEYVYEGWRAMQWLLFALGALGSLLVFFALPETSHSKAIDAIREERRAAKGDTGLSKAEGEEKWWKGEGWVWVWINPLEPLRLLARPHILAMSLNSSFVLMSTYTILVPLGETLAPRYHITNAAILGCFYLAQGFGNYIAASFTGRYADYVLKTWLKKRNGVYVPEDRLKATLIGGGFILPVSVLVLGWTMEYVGGTGGIVAAVILLVVDGIGLMIVLTPANTYCVDVMQDRSAEVVAVNNMVRYTFSAAASAFVLPLIHKIGIGWANTFAAALVWCGFLIVLTTIRYGERMRKWGVSGSEDGEKKSRPAEDSGESTLADGEMETTK
ncbi:MFS general substrate transporter [Meredithblackwellia eburnea MCA 4105]